MKITFLGTNGWYDSPTGNTVCVFIETRDEYIIFDAGSGLSKIDTLIKHAKPIRLFLSHFHLDHTIGFHTLAKFKFSQGLDIYGPHGLKDFFNKVIRQPYTVPIAKLKTRVRLHEISGRAGCLPGNVTSGKLKHSSLCLGYRLILENKTVSYCTDTGICKNLLLLAQGADLLIAECALRPGQESPEWPHLNPQSVARAARDARVLRLAMVHFDACFYPGLKEREEAQFQARKIFKGAFACRDGQKLSL